ncbi:DUF3360 family protein [uncultured Meiothermus sp.]|uniref:DUF3360 family protein n=1 Tax=uncultured Meiothermus sp. TaxID=157471 RepID=UPI002608B8C8|nr:DUF3360 family protein [uncultured Meiothermus sp.]
MTEYQKAHRAASEFETREKYLEHELEITQPRPWRLNLPGRDYRFEPEDIVPAISGTIGKIVMVTAVVSTFAAGFGLSKEFIAENVRYELLIAAILFVIPISGFINPRANLPGVHGPMIPLIGLIIMAGGHPLALGILVGVFGLILAFFKGGSRLASLTGTGVRAGLLIILGVVGLLAQLDALRKWAVGLERELIFLVIVAATILLYAYLARIGKRWLAIPLASLVAVLAALGMGAPFKFVSTPGIPNLNPFYWWGSETGWMLGLPTLEHFIAVLPFAILAIAMWPPDFLSHRIFQEINYPKRATRSLMDIDDTMIVCSIRQAVGSLLGGGNLTSSWGTYMIPAAIARRPIAAGAILTGVGCATVAILGFPMDLAKWEPVLRVALMVGVFLPLLEAGMAMIRTTKDAEGAGICIFGAVLVNPVFGWALAMVLDNSGLIDPERGRSLPTIDRYIIPIITFLVAIGVMALVGLIPGIPAVL